MLERVFAAQGLGTIGGEGLGPFGNQSLGNNAIGAINVINTISSIVGIMTTAACIWFLLQILFGGYEWMAAGGDPKKIESARSRITNAFIGLVIVVGSWSLLAVTGQFFGFNTLVNPAEFINQVTPR
jgi:hypothetical protein